MTVFTPDDRDDFDLHAWENWAKIHDFDLGDVYRIEVLRTKVRIYRFKRDDKGRAYLKGKDIAREKARTIQPIFPVPV